MAVTASCGQTISTPDGHFQRPPEGTVSLCKPSLSRIVLGHCTTSRVIAPPQRTQQVTDHHDLESSRKLRCRASTMFTNDTYSLLCMLRFPVPLQSLNTGVSVLQVGVLRYAFQEPHICHITCFMLYKLYNCYSVSTAAQPQNLWRLRRALGAA
jgi:hypothetical protein